MQSLGNDLCFRSIGWASVHRSSVALGQTLFRGSADLWNKRRCTCDMERGMGNKGENLRAG